jgi:hypothetical protein
MNQKEEKTLRDSIRQMIGHVKEKRLVEENKLRSIIQGFTAVELEALLREGSTPDVDPTPNKSTGINMLEQLLKKIIPIVEEDYKSLTTDDSQRASFRSHIINAVVNTLAPAKVNTSAGEDNADEMDVNLAEIDITVGGEQDDKFIDIRTDAERSAADEEDAKEEDPRSAFGDGIEGDETGRNVAYQSFKKIETNIIDSYELLSNEEDQELFYDYLIANLKLYFDKFEEELASAVQEPTNQAYDMAKDSTEEPAPEMAALQEYINSL